MTAIVNTFSVKIARENGTDKLYIGAEDVGHKIMYRIFEILMHTRRDSLSNNASDITTKNCNVEMLETKIN